MILVIDNYDSFTYNLVQAIESLGYRTKVFANDQLALDEVKKMKPKKIVISPGPGTPEDAGISMDVIKNFYKKTPILGVCLGHQCMGAYFGADLIHAKKIMHGKTSVIRHNSKGLFQAMPNDFIVARYHSLAIDNIKPPLRVTAKSEDGTIMAIEHENYPVFGVQFHPESFLTSDGRTIIRNFLR
ncbi:MAG TPA: aminodeoxychorismate/anthranilate synthase component II [Patescibacteria group bacterium]|nr:aminodeoxychorismate/anthranilate synthase component II [Patescibacteria group bacterium]